MKIFSILKVLAFTLISFGAASQSFDLYLSSDSILAGNVLEVTFKAENINGSFEGPDLKGLEIVSGPNTTSFVTMRNGEMSQTESYSYGILLNDIGVVTVTPAYLHSEDKSWETEPVSVIVLPNPEGIIEQPPKQSGLFEFGFPGEVKRKQIPNKSSKSKKRKLKRF